MNVELLDEDALVSLLAQWGPQAAMLLAGQVADPLLERLRQVLAALAHDLDTVTKEDLIALVRQWLLRRFSQGGPAWLSVPGSAGWPSCDEWRAAGFETAQIDNRIELRASHPRLSWLEAQEDLFDDAFDLVEVRRTDWVPADPHIAHLLGIPSFTGPGQREAVRALVHLPSDVTLIANLPTGSGKSLLAQLPPLLHGEGHLTLVIVPTVSLCIDQDARMAELLKLQNPRWEKRPLAYHSGLNTEQRTQVFQGLREGRQTVLFTSPEAATGSLREALEASAREGRLTHIIVDEAHLVATWGNGFRPAFQLLPALIARMRTLSKETAQRSIRVVLASATLTPHAVRFLQHRFNSPEKTQVVSGIYLRPEPRYAIRRCASLHEKQRLAIEALKVAPRPFILYVTRPEEARDWLDLLLAAGFGRISQFTGDTPAAERKSLLDDWRNNRLDGMVATSAFGLGVDKGDVRTVVHATLPESLDRFYQEVGRSGRDGRAAASLLLFTEEDIHQARSMSGERLIGNDIAFKRWTSMLDYQVSSFPDSGEIWLDLNRLRPELSTQGKTNRLWNLRTLNLMAAAGLIEITALSHRSPAASPPRDGGEELTESQVAFAAVRITDASHRQREIFDIRMNEARQQASHAAERTLALMLAAANRKVSMEDALSGLYRLALPNAWAPVTSACGGCPAHWGTPRLRDFVPRPFVGRISQFDPRSSYAESILRALPRAQSNLLFIVVDDVRRVLCAPPGGLADALLSRVRPHTVLLPVHAAEAEVQALRARLERLRVDSFLDRYDPNQPDTLDGGSHEIRLLFWRDLSVPPAAHSQLIGVPCALTIVLMPPAVADPQRPDRLWATVIEHADEDTVLRALNT